MEKLRDIKGIVEVTDYSLYYLIGAILAVVIVLAILIYIFMQPKKRKKPTSAQIALKNLKNIDYENSKDVSYVFTLNIPFFETPENKEKIRELLDKLEVYKYKKYIPNMDKELKDDIKSFIKGLK